MNCSVFLQKPLSVPVPHFLPRRSVTTKSIVLCSYSTLYLFLPLSFSQGEVWLLNHLFFVPTEPCIYSIHVPHFLPGRSVTTKSLALCSTEPYACSCASRSSMQGEVRLISLVLRSYRTLYLFLCLTFIPGRSVTTKSYVLCSYRTPYLFLYLTFFSHGEVWPLNHLFCVCSQR